MTLSDGLMYFQFASCVQGVFNIGKGLLQIVLLVGSNFFQSIQQHKQALKTVPKHGHSENFVMKFSKRLWMASYVSKVTLETCDC